MKKAALQPFCAFNDEYNIVERGEVYEKMSEMRINEF